MDACTVHCYSTYPKGVKEIKQCSYTDTVKSKGIHNVDNKNKRQFEEGVCETNSNP